MRKKHTGISAMLKKIYYLTLFGILLSPALLFSAEGEGDSPNAPPPSGGGSTGLTNPLKAKSLTAFLVDVLEIVRDIGFLVAVIFIIYAGFLFVTAQGDEGKLSTAKQAFLWAVVGTAVLLGAQIFANAIGETVHNIGVETKL